MGKKAGSTRAKGWFMTRNLLTKPLIASRVSKTREKKVSLSILSAIKMSIINPQMWLKKVNLVKEKEM